MHQNYRYNEKFKFSKTEQRLAEIDNNKDDYRQRNVR